MNSFTINEEIYLIYRKTDMLNMNELISSNIVDNLRKSGKSQIDLAHHLGISNQSMSDMLDGSRTINVEELQGIAGFLNVPMKELVRILETTREVDVVQSFIDNGYSDSARKGLELADQLANLICFYARANENAERMMQLWEA